MAVALSELGLRNKERIEAGSIMPDSRVGGAITSYTPDLIQAAHKILQQRTETQTPIIPNGILRTTRGVDIMYSEIIFPTIDDDGHPAQKKIRSKIPQVVDPLDTIMQPNGELKKHDLYDHTLLRFKKNQ